MQMKMNKNGVKLLATLMVLAVAFAGATVVFNGSDAEATESPIIKFSDSAVVSISNDGTSYVISGFVPKSTSTTTIDETLFTDDFGEDAIGYGYAILDKSIVGGASKIVQKNSALALYEGDENISGNKTTGWVKTSNYDTPRPDYDLNFLIPTDGSIVTFEVTVGEKTTTYTFDFKKTNALDALDSDGFLALKDKDSVVKLEKDYIIAGPVLITSNLTVTMNGHSLYANGDMFAGKATEANCTFTINGDNQSKMIASDNGEVPSVYYQSGTSTKSISLDVNGGYYEGVYTFSCGTNATFGGTVSISDATVVAKKVTSEWSEAIWTSYGGFESVTIERTDVESDGIGIYLGVQKKATLTDVNVESDGTAVEVKSGIVSITGGSLHSNSFVKADGTINQNGTGAGEATLNINNGYEKNLDTPGTVSVTVNGTEITNSAGAPIQICAGVYDSSGEKDCPGDIIFTSKVAIPLSDLSIVRYSADSEKDEREISVNINGQAQDIETSDVEDAEGLEDAIEGKDYSSITISADISVESDIKITEGQTISVSTNGNKLTATIKNSNNNNNVVKLNGVVGDFVIRYGSIQISGDFDEGSMTVYGDAYIIGNTTIAAGVTLNIAEGANLTINDGYTVDILGTVISNGIITNKGTINVDGDGKLNSWGEFNNNGALVISGAGAVSGTVKNANGTISISSNTPMSDLQIIGGSVDADSGVKIPILDGSTITKDGIKYTGYKFVTAEGITVIIGVPQVEYNGQNYGGKVVTLKPLQAYLPDGEVKDVDGNAYSNSSKIYQKEADAIAGNTEYGTCVDAGNYYVRISTMVKIVESAYGTLPIDFVASYPVLKKDLTGVEIYGMAFGDSIRNQTWTDGDIIYLTYGTDYRIYFPNGSVCNIDSAYFDVDYLANDAPGTATITVTFKKNFTSDEPIYAEFTIVQGLKKLQITTENTFRVGQEITETDFNIVGIYQDNRTTTEASILADPQIVKVKVDDKDAVSIANAPYFMGSTVTLIFENDDGVTGEITVEIVQIEKITIADIPVTDGFKKVYNAGDELLLKDMQIQVKYKDDKTAIFNYDDNAKKFEIAITSTVTVTLSNEIEVGPEVFNTYVGDDVKITATYFESSGFTLVKVKGYGIIYLDANGNEIGWQCGVVGKNAAVYNYIWDLTENETFAYWIVEDTDAIYLPGTMIGYGENAEMWGMTKANTLYLHAKILADCGVVTYPENVTVVDENDNTIESGTPVIFGTEITITYDVEVPEGMELTVAVNGVPLVGEDGTYTYTVDSDAVNITAEVAAPGSEYSDDFIVNIHYDVNERLVISLQSLDGKVIPAGTVYFSGFYTVMEEVIPGLVLPSSYSFDDFVHFEEGETYKVILPTEQTGYVVGMISIQAEYISDDSTITEQANLMTFEFVAVSNEE